MFKFAGPRCSFKMLLSSIEGSPSLEVVNLVLQKRAKGEKVISLAIGDPEANTPREIEDALFPR